VVRPTAGRYFAASVTLLAGVHVQGDRDFAKEIMRRGYVPRSKVDDYLVDSVARRNQGLPLVHVADWMAERGLITADQRRIAEDAIPATWIARVKDTLTPIGWAGDSIAIYEVK